MTQPRKKRVSREKPIQKAVVDYLRAVLPGAIVHHARGEINKSGASIARELAEAKRLGAMKGFPDILCVLPAHIGVAFFEVKAPGNYPSPEQSALHQSIRDLGHPVAVVRNIEDTAAALDAWGIWRADRHSNIRKD